jgi:hypothetical protein
VIKDESAVPVKRGLEPGQMQHCVQAEPKRQKKKLNYVYSDHPVA